MSEMAPVPQEEVTLIDVTLAMKDLVDPDVANEILVKAHEIARDRRYRDRARRDWS